jgi:guanylate kinase
VFVLPPTMETLKARLEGRQTETEALQEKRLAEADGEIAFACSSGYYPHIITNDILQDSVTRVLEIIEREKHR